MEPKAKIVTLVLLEFDRGTNDDSRNPVRRVKQYRSPAGKVLWEDDPLDRRARVDAIQPLHVEEVGRPAIEIKDMAKVIGRRDD